jgi:hypothetical protein
LWPVKYAGYEKFCKRELTNELRQIDNNLLLGKPPARAVKLSDVTTKEQYDKLIKSLNVPTPSNTKTELINHELANRINLVTDLFFLEENLTYDQLLEQLSSHELKCLVNNIEDFSAKNLRFLAVIDALFQLRDRLNEIAQSFWSDEKIQLYCVLKYYENQLNKDLTKQDESLLTITDSDGKEISKLNDFKLEFAAAYQKFVIATKEELALFSRFSANLHSLIYGFCDLHEEQVTILLRELYASNSCYFKQYPWLLKAYDDFVGKFPQELTYIQKLIAPDPKGLPTLKFKGGLTNRYILEITIKPKEVQKDAKKEVQKKDPKIDRMNAQKDNQKIKSEAFAEQILNGKLESFSEQAMNNTDEARKLEERLNRRFKFACEHGTINQNKIKDKIKNWYQDQTQDKSVEKDAHELPKTFPTLPKSKKPDKNKK